MSKPVLYLGAVCFSLLLAGTVASARSANPLADVHTVLVVSAVGNDVKWQHSAPGFLHLDRPTLTYHTDWKLDAFLAQKVKDALRDRFTVIEDEVDPTLLEDLMPGTPESIAAKLNERFANITPLQGLDAYVVIHSRPDDVDNPFISMSFDALGVNRAVPIIGGDKTFAFANYQVSVIDARKGKVIASGLSMGVQKILWERAQPIVSCDNSIWSDTPEQLSDAQKQQLQAEFLALTAKTLPYALEEAHLIPPIKKDLDITEWEGRKLVCD